MRLKRRRYNLRLFRAWQEGILLDFKNGSGLVLDGSPIVAELDTVEAFMDSGGVVELEDDWGRPISTLRLESVGVPEPGYVEEEIAQPPDRSGVE